MHWCHYDFRCWIKSLNFANKLFLKAGMLGKRNSINPNSLMPNGTIITRITVNSN